MSSSSARPQGANSATIKSKRCSANRRSSASREGASVTLNRSSAQGGGDRRAERGVVVDQKHPELGVGKVAHRVVCSDGRRRPSCVAFEMRKPPDAVESASAATRVSHDRPAGARGETGSIGRGCRYSQLRNRMTRADGAAAVKRARSINLMLKVGRRTHEKGGDRANFSARRRRNRGQSQGHAPADRHALPAGPRNVADFQRERRLVRSGEFDDRPHGKCANFSHRRTPGRQNHAHRDVAFEQHRRRRRMRLVAHTQGTGEWAARIIHKTGTRTKRTEVVARAVALREASTALIIARGPRRSLRKSL